MIYTITNRVSGHCLGQFEGDSPEEAIAAMDEQAGSSSREHVAEVLGRTVDELRDELLVEPAEDG